jgi:hypothetical protein
MFLVALALVQAPALQLAGEGFFAHTEKQIV